MKHVELDDLDKKLRTSIPKRNGILLSALRKQYPDLRYGLLYYRLNTLAEAGYIRLERGRRVVRCYSIDSAEVQNE